MLDYLLQLMLSKKSNIKNFDSIDIQNNLLKLMQAFNITEAKLARETNLPQTTINRLLSNQKTDPRINTLIPIAQYFGVSLDELVGIKNLKSGFESVYKSDLDRVVSIPVFDWKQLRFWKDCSSKIKLSNHKDWIVTSLPNIQELSFGVKTLKVHEPYFCYGSILIIVKLKVYEEGMTVLVEKEDQFICRKLMFYDKNWNVSALGKTRLLSDIVNTDAIIGHIAEVRFNFT